MKTFSMARAALRTLCRSCRKLLKGCFARKPRILAPNLWRVYMNGRLAGQWWETAPLRYKKYPSPYNMGNHFYRLFREGFEDTKYGRPPRYKTLKQIEIESYG